MGRRLHSLLAVAALLVLGLGVSGCQHSEPDNVSVRPWNSTEGWQGGFPSTLNEGR
jgi:hypothetical protein